MNKTVFAVLAVAWAVGTLGAEEATICQQENYQVSITNVSRESITGYVKGSATSGFYVEPGETLRVALPASQGKREYRTSVYLQDKFAEVSEQSSDESGRCTEYVLVPKGCPSDKPAAYLYLYQVSGVPSCFMRSVVRPSRAGRESQLVRSR